MIAPHPLHGFLYSIFNNAKQIFAGRNLYAHLLAILITYALVTSGLDWRWAQFSTQSPLTSYVWPAVALGFLVPAPGLIVFYFVSILRRYELGKVIAYALGQAAFLGLILSSIYKFFTGRIPPPHAIIPGTNIDTSTIFQFGFNNGGIFWGWPSGHTTVAFATACALVTLLPRHKILRVVVLVYAFYVGIGVAMTIHWFSDFVAGAIIGSVIGVVVGKSFRKHYLGR